jgi:hypothetical protein
MEAVGMDAGCSASLGDVYPNGHEAVLHYRERMRNAVCEAAAYV